MIVIIYLLFGSIRIVWNLMLPLKNDVLILCSHLYIYWWLILMRRNIFSSFMGSLFLSFYRVCWLFERVNWSFGLIYNLTFMGFLVYFVIILV